MTKSGLEKSFVVKDQQMEGPWVRVCSEGISCGLGAVRKT